MTTGTTPATLFDQVGGFDGVDQAVNRLFAGLAAAPDLSRLLPSGDTGEARWEVQMLLTDLLGGPMSYDGPDPRVVAGRLDIESGVSGTLLDRTVASFVEAGIEQRVATALRARLVEAARSWGLLPAGAPSAGSPPAAAAPEPVDPSPGLVAAGGSV
jgi:truncated hemoglobin YjbI